MSDSNDEHRLLRHSAKFDKILKIIKSMVDEDGENIRRHDEDGCPECGSFCDNFRRRMDEIGKSFDEKHPNNSPPMRERW